MSNATSLSTRHVVLGITGGIAAYKSAELVRLLYDEGTLAILTTDRNSSHLAEQLAVKAFVPVIAISADRTLTSVNIPWIFRLPKETDPTAALRCLLDAAERSGPNRNTLREALASSQAIFDGRGDPR